MCVSYVWHRSVRVVRVKHEIIYIKCILYAILMGNKRESFHFYTRVYAGRVLFWMGTLWSRYFGILLFDSIRFGSNSIPIYQSILTVVFIIHESSAFFLLLKPYQSYDEFQFYNTVFSETIEQCFFLKQENKRQNFHEICKKLAKTTWEQKRVIDP